MGKIGRHTNDIFTLLLFTFLSVRANYNPIVFIIIDFSQTTLLPRIYSFLFSPVTVHLFIDMQMWTSFTISILHYLSKGIYVLKVYELKFIFFIFEV